MAEFNPLDYGTPVKEQKTFDPLKYGTPVGSEPENDLSFDPEGESYDYATAEKYGITADETGHWPSRAPNGQILKGQKHYSYEKTVAGEEAADHVINKGEDGRYYSQPRMRSPEVKDPLASGKRVQAEISSTLKNIGKVYPVVDTGLNLVTGAYGTVAAGLGGIATLLATGDVDKATKAIAKLQDILVHKPMTPKGQELTEATTYPLKKLDEFGDFVAGPIAEAGHLKTAALVKGAIGASPAIIGGRASVKSGLTRAVPTITKVGTEFSKVVKAGISKGIKPAKTAVGKKLTGPLLDAYYKKADSVVKQIVDNVDNLKLIDKDGNVTKGLPKTLPEMSQALTQLKRKVFEAYDKMGKLSDARAGAPKVDLLKTVDALEKYIADKSIQSHRKNTVKYAKDKIEQLKQDKSRTAVESQRDVEILNEGLTEYYKGQGNKTKGQASVDAIIVENQRTQLGAMLDTMSKDKGNPSSAGYLELRRQYRDILALEPDVNNRAFLDLKKTDKSSLNFSDIVGSHQIVVGALRGDPASIAAGTGIKAVASWFKHRGKSDTIISNMFKKVEKLERKLEGKKVAEPPKVVEHAEKVKSKREKRQEAIAKKKRDKRKKAKKAKEGLQGLKGLSKE